MRDVRLTIALVAPTHAGKAKQLVKQLLARDRTKRLGCLKGGAHDVMASKWLRKIDWDKTEARNLAPP